MWQVLYRLPQTFHRISYILNAIFILYNDPVEPYNVVELNKCGKPHYFSSLWKYYIVVLHLWMCYSSFMNSIHFVFPNPNKGSWASPFIYILRIVSFYFTAWKLRYLLRNHQSRLNHITTTHVKGQKNQPRESTPVVSLVGFLVFFFFLLSFSKGCYLQNTHHTLGVYQNKVKDGSCQLGCSFR